MARATFEFDGLGVKVVVDEDGVRLVGGEEAREAALWDAVLAEIARHQEDLEWSLTAYRELAKLIEVEREKAK
jgi:hypothetical protein